MMRTYESAGIAVPDTLLPTPGIDLTKWAVVACDQYTSQPTYWNDVEKLVGSEPSTLNLIYPEVYLGESTPEDRITRIRKSMTRYLEQGLLAPREGLVYVERQTAGNVRKGLVLCVDLERYDFAKGSKSLIRATEGTILDRLPPRIKIRQGAPLELPHIMVLIDDPENTVLGQITAKKAQLNQLYDFDLMMGAGHLTGYLVDDLALEKRVIAAFEGLANPETFCSKYGLPSNTPVLLFAMGDGNHSLATAKAIWEEAKKDAKDPRSLMESSTRYALVEIVNLHDDALVFEPIHRVIFDIAEKHDLLAELSSFYAGRIEVTSVASIDEMTAKVRESSATHQRVGAIHQSGYQVIEITQPDSNLPVGSLQSFLDPFMKDGKAKEIDYVHGTEPVDDLGRKPGNMGFFLPAMDKFDLFKTVILDGALPRKTFSMGEADEKRFYMECRRL